MAYDIGPKIGIDGESEFRKALKNVSENIKTLGSEMKVVASRFADNAESTDALSEKNEVLAKQIDAVEEKIRLQQDAVEKAADKFGDAGTETLKWKRALNESIAELNNLKTQVDKNERAMDGLDDAMEDVTNEAKEMGGEFGALDVALGDLASKGIQAAVSGIGKVVRSIVGLGESTREFRAEQAKLATAFESAGHSAETAEDAYQGLYGVLGDSGEATEASQLLASLANNTEDVAKWTDIAAGVTGTFGDALPIPSLIEAANETAKVGEVTGALADALNWVGISEDEFNTRLSELATTEERTAAITDMLSEAYAGAAEAFQENNAEIIKANENQLLLDNSLAKIGESVDGVKNSLLEAFGPTITAAAESLASYIGKIDVTALKEGVDGLLSSFNNLVPVIAGAAAAMVAYKAAVGISALLDGVKKATEGMTIAQAALNVVMNANPFVLIATLIAGLVAALVTLWHTNDGFRDAVISAWEKIKEVFGVVVEAIVGFFTETIPNAFQAVIEFFTKTVPEAISNFVERIGAFFTETIPGFFESLVQWFSELPEKIAYWLGFAIGKLIDWGAQAIEWVTTEVPKIIENIVNFFAELPGKIWAWLVDAVKKIAEWVVSANKKAQEIRAKVIETVVNFFKELPGKIWTWLVNTVAKIGEFISNMGQKIRTEVPKIITSFLNFFKELPGKILEIGKNIVDGLWNGIKNAWSSLTSKVTGLFGNLVQGVKDGLGIRSPSRVFAGIGENMAAGIGVGFDGEFGQIQKQLNQSMSSLIPDVSGNVSVTGTASGAIGEQIGNPVLSAEILKSALSGLGVYLSGQRVGELTTIAQRNNARALGTV